MRATSGSRSWIVVGLGCLLVLAVYARSVSAGRLTHGFVAYHTAARLLLERQMGAHVYDFAWFRAEVQRRTETRVLEIFGPNPPTMSLLALPVAAFEPRMARALWLFISLAALAVSAFVLARETRPRHTSLLPIAVAVVLISPAVFANLRTGQGYLVIGACFAGTAVALARRRDTLAGICLGLAIILKTAGMPWLLVLAMARRWRAFGATVATATLIALVTLPWTGLETWRAYPGAVAAFVALPTTGITAYQTTLGFMRHWCGPELPSAGGLTGCTTGATLAAWLVLGVAVALTGHVVRHAPARLANAAGVSLSLLCVPIAEDHQFVLLAVAIFALLTTAPRWLWTAAAVLLLIPAPVTIERYTAGWLSILAYPRLYATWLVWALTIHGVRTAQEKEDGGESQGGPLGAIGRY
jgi:hypothetical protein